MSDTTIVIVEDDEEGDAGTDTEPCPTCDAMNATDAKFCDQCGAALASDTPARSAPRDGLLRSVPFLAEPGDGLTLEGYAAVFDDPAMIDSWEGTFRESIMPGAFAKTIAEKTPVLMFDHGQHPMVGSIPIGTITDLRENGRGLFVRATLADNWLIEPVRQAIAGQSISGMSIRMTVNKDTWGRGTDNVVERSIHEVGLAELGPVVFPAYENTQVSVRSREAIATLHDPEMRAEIARILVGTPDLGAAEHPEPGIAPSHSVQTHLRRRALALLALS